MEPDLYSSWQKVLVSLLNNFGFDGRLEEFLGIESDKDRLKYVMDKYVSCEAINKWLHSFDCRRYQKNEAEARRLRTIGNDYFRKKDRKLAKEYYTESVLAAPDGGPELALAYANRSAVYFELDSCKECLEDISNALSCGYPLNSQHKLYQRQAKCYMKNSVFSLEKALQAAELSSSLESGKKEEIKLELTNLLEKFKSEVTTSSAVEANTEQQQMCLEPRDGFHDKISAASKALEVRQSKTQGRYFVTNCKISAGDVLFVEKPYASVLLPSQYTKRCHNCYHALNLTYGCKHCTQARYCSKSCRDASWDSYHKYECMRLDILDERGIAHLAYRIVLRTGLSNLLDFKSTVEDERRQKQKPGITGCRNGFYRNDYYTVYHLQTHAEDMNSADQLLFMITAGLLLKLLDDSKFFKPDSLQLEDKLYIGYLLYRHCQQLVCNAHAITALQASDSLPVDDEAMFEVQEQVRIATAIYPSASLMNHACDPTIINSFDGSTLVVKAVKDVEEGQEVYNCYGPHFRRMPLEERRDALQQQYKFFCQCTACKQGDEDMEIYEAQLCSACNGPVVNLVCRDCKAEIDAEKNSQVIQHARHLHNEGVIKLNNGDIKEALEMVLQSAALQEKVLYKYNKELAMTWDVIARCYALLDDFERSACYLAKAVDIIGEVYGSSSIEVGNDLLKYSDVLCCSLKQMTPKWDHVEDRKFIDTLKKAKEVIRRALKIFRLHYTESHESIKDLEETEKALKCMSGRYKDLIW